MKEISEVCALYLTKIRNKEMFEKNQLSDNLKLADVAPVLKKKILILVQNYRPVAVLLVISKILKDNYKNK